MNFEKDALTVSDLISLLKEFEDGGHGDIVVCDLGWSAIRKQDVRLAMKDDYNTGEETQILLIE